MIPPPPKQSLKAVINRGGITEAKKVFNVGEWVIYRWLDELELDNPFARCTDRPSKDELKKKVAEFDTLVEVAAHYKCSPKAIYKWMQDYDLADNRPEGMVSLSEASRELGVTKVAVFQWYKRGLIQDAVRTRHYVYFPLEQLSLLKQAVKAGILGKKYKGRNKPGFPRSLEEIKSRLTNEAKNGHGNQDQAEGGQEQPV
jgi:hypothetical protein